MPRALTAATRAMQARFIAVSAEATPNPSAMIFTLEGGKPILGKGAKSMSFEKTQCGGSPLAASLFRVDYTTAALPSQTVCSDSWS